MCNNKLLFYSVLVLQGILSMMANRNNKIAHLASLFSPSQWSPFSPQSEPERERSSPAALSLAHLSWGGGNQKICHCLFVNTVRRSFTSLFERDKERASEKENKWILYSEHCVCAWAANLLYIPGSLFFQGFCRFGSLVDNLFSTVLLHVSLIRHHLRLQRLLRLLVTVAPAGATLRGQAKKAGLANQHVTGRKQLADPEQINDMFEIVWIYFHCERVFKNVCLLVLLLTFSNANVGCYMLIWYLISHFW